MKVVHEWLKEYVGPAIPSVEKLEELFMFHAFEVEGIERVGEHEVLELKILPDRASYCLSHRGIAREIASITGTPLVYDPLTSEERLPAFSDIAVDIKDTHACTRFGAALMSGITVQDSPQWLKARLIALGQRPINNIVDATNYVMYALGQPLHAYDAKKFPQVNGQWQFQVRFADKGEKISLIAEGNKEGDRIVELTGTELLIVDAAKNVPIGLAGVKGGAFAGVDAETVEIIIEAAHFDPIITRKTARRLGIVIDASKRFENDPSPELIPHALREVAALIREIAGGNCAGSIDVIAEPLNTQAATVDPKRVNALLGLALTASEIIDILKRIGAEVAINGEVLSVRAPWERNDLNIEEDYIDEIGRIHGYEHVVSVVPASVPLTEYNTRHFYSEKIREVLVQEGFSEVITSSFSKKDEVRLRNALASDKSFMRSHLRGNISDVLDKNVNLADLLGKQDTRVFEIGTVFNTAEEGEVAEHTSLALGVRLKASGYSGKDDTTLSSVIALLEQELGTPLSFEIHEGVGECDLTKVLERLSAPLAYEKIAISEEIVYKPFSLYPAVARDIALWVPEGTTPEHVEGILDGSAGDLRVRTTLVDVFSKEGRTSYAFRMVFQSSERTLTDAEVNAEMERVYAAAAAQGFEAR